MTACRELFNTRNQKEGEPFANFLMDVKNLIKACEYETIEDSMLKDRLTWGLFDPRQGSAESEA